MTEELHSNDDFSSSVSLSDISDSVGRLIQWVGSINDRCEFSGPDELLENNQVFLRSHRDKRTQPLAYEGRQRERANHATHGSDPATVHISTIGYESPLSGERAPAGRQRMVRHIVEDEIITEPTPEPVNDNGTL